MSSPSFISVEEQDTQNVIEIDIYLTATTFLSAWQLVQNVGAEKNSITLLGWSVDVGVVSSFANEHIIDVP